MANPNNNPYGSLEVSQASKFTKKLIETETPSKTNDQALNFRENQRLKIPEKKSPYWNTWDIKKSSLGTALHFTLLKQLILMITVTSIFSIIQIIINSQDGYYKSYERQSRLDQLLIGNIYGVRKDSNQELDSEKMDKNYKIIWVTDLFYVLISLGFILGFFFYTHSYLKELNINQPKISDFAVEVKGFSDKNYNEEEFRKEFEHEKNLIQFVFGRKFGKILDLYSRKTKIKRKIEIKNKFVEYLNRNIDNYEIDANREKIQTIIDKQRKKIRKLTRNIKKYQVKIENCKNNKPLNDLSVSRAYIVYKNIEHKEKELKNYNKYRCGCLRLLKKNRRIITHNNERLSLDIKPTHEPSDIIWENLEYSKFNRLVRVTISLLITIIVFSLSIIMIYYVKTAQSRIPSDDTCKDYSGNSKGSSKSSDERLCYCRGLSGSEMLNNSDTCSVYIEYLSQAMTLKFLSAFGITIVNLILRIIICKLTAFEKPKIRSQINQRVFLKIFIVTFINTSILTYLINLKISGIESSTERGFDDFDREWFLNVGNYILAVMLVSLFSPHLLYMVFVGSYGWFKRKYYHLWRPLNQYKMNKIFKRPKFDLPGRTAQVINVFFTCFLYSGGIPLLNLVCLVFLVIIYFSDLFLLYKHFRVPEKSNDLMYFTVIKILPLAVFLHCCFSFYTYGSPSIFQIKSAHSEVFHKTLTENVANRLERASGISNMILILLTAVVALIILFLHPYLMRKRNEYLTNFILINNIDSNRCDTNNLNRHSFESERTELNAKSYLYSDLIKNGLSSYDITHNEDYKDIVEEFKQLNNIQDDHRI